MCLCVCVSLVSSLICMVVCYTIPVLYVYIYVFIIIMLHVYHLYVMLSPSLYVSLRLPHHTHLPLCICHCSSHTYHSLTHTVVLPHTPSLPHAYMRAVYFYPFPLEGLGCAWWRLVAAHGERVLTTLLHTHPTPPPPTPTCICVAACHIPTHTPPLLTFVTTLPLYFPTTPACTSTAPHTGIHSPPHTFTAFPAFTPHHTPTTPYMPVQHALNGGGFMSWTCPYAPLRVSFPSPYISAQPCMVVVRMGMGHCQFTIVCLLPLYTPCPVCIVSSSYSSPHTRFPTALPAGGMPSLYAYPTPAGGCPTFVCAVPRGEHYLGDPAYCPACLGFHACPTCPCLLAGPPLFFCLPACCPSLCPLPFCLCPTLPSYLPPPCSLTIKDLFLYCRWEPTCACQTSL